jgi:hypothetical protein
MQLITAQGLQEGLGWAEASLVSSQPTTAGAEYTPTFSS